MQDDNGHLGKIVVGIGLVASVIGIGLFGWSFFDQADEELSARLDENYGQAVANGERLNELTDRLIVSGQLDDFELPGGAASGRTNDANGNGIVVEASLGTPGGGSWSRTFDYEPGDRIRVLASLAAESDVQVENLIVGVIVDQRFSYEKGSTELVNGNHPGGVAIESDNIVSGGINTGAYARNGYAYVTFTIVADEEGWFCGTATPDLSLVVTATVDGSALPIAVAAPSISVINDC